MEPNQCTGLQIYFCNEGLKTLTMPIALEKAVDSLICITLNCSVV